MRLQDKIAINNMRLDGHGPSVIAAKLGLPAGEEYCHIRTILTKKYGLSSDSIFAECA